MRHQPMHEIHSHCFADGWNCDPPCRPLSLRALRGGAATMEMPLLIADDRGRIQRASRQYVHRARQSEDVSGVSTDLVKRR
jgi:hypothetical protein